jgi:hypothetical protein
VLASALAGVLVLPSLATEAALQHAITVLKRAGQTSTMCISILLAPLQPQTTHQMVQHSGSGTGSYSAGQPPVPPGAGKAAGEQLADASPASGSDAQQEGAAPPAPQASLSPRRLQQQPSLLLEDPAEAGALVGLLQQAAQPGQWGLRSFLAASSASASASPAPPAAGGARGSAGTGGVLPAQAPRSPAAGGVAGAPGAAGLQGPAATAGSGGVHGAAGVAPAAAAAAAAPHGAADEDQDVWGHDHRERGTDGELSWFMGRGLQAAAVPEQQHQGHQQHERGAPWAQPRYAVIRRGRRSCDVDEFDAVAPYVVTSSGSSNDSRSGSSGSSNGSSGSSGGSSGSSGSSSGSSGGITGQPQHGPQAGSSGAANTSSSSDDGGALVVTAASNATAASSSGSRAVTLNGAGAQHTNMRHTKSSPVSLAALGRRTAPAPAGGDACARAAAPPDAAPMPHNLAFKALSCVDLGNFKQLRPAPLALSMRSSKAEPQPQQPPHYLIRLQRGVDMIRPLMQELKLLQAAVVVEQSAWVRLLLGAAPRRALAAATWQPLVDALDGLLDRCGAVVCVCLLPCVQQQRQCASGGRCG